MSHSGFRWNRQPEEAPGPKATAKKVEEVIWSMIDPLHFISLSELERRRLLRAICESEGWSWPQVAQTVRRSAIAARAREGRTEVIEYTVSGIPVFPERFAEPQPMCPFKRKSFHLGLWATKYFNEDCNSPSERRCGSRTAEELLQQVKTRLFGLAEVHFAVAIHDEELSNRMGQRRFSRKISTFTYRDVNDEVTILADGPAGGRTPPETSQPMPWREAIDRLIPRLWVPGHRAHDFSAGWKFPTGASADNDFNIALDGLTDEQVTEFERQASDLLSTYDIEPGVDGLPAELWGEARAKLLAIRGDIRDRGLGARQPPEL